MTTIRGALVLVATALALSASVRPAAAQSDTTQRNHLYDKLQFTLSGTAVVINSNIRVDGSNGQGTDLNAEEDLGLARTKFQPRLALRWRPGKRHELELGYQFARRTGDKVLTKDIEFGDSTFTAGLRVKSTYNSDQAFLVYRFALMAKERSQVGLALGVGPYFLETGIDATGSISSGDQSQSGSRSVSKSIVGPTGSLGVYGRSWAGERWYLEGDLRYIKVTIDRFDARVYAVNASARYFVSPAVALEAGYGFDGVKVDVGPKTTGITAGLISGQIKFSQQNFRLGVVWTP